MDYATLSNLTGKRQYDVCWYTYNLKIPILHGISKTFKTVKHGKPLQNTIVSGVSFCLKIVKEH